MDTLSRITTDFTVFVEQPTDLPRLAMLNIIFLFSAGALTALLKNKTQKKKIKIKKNFHYITK